MNNENLFIVFEGIDGSGTTTQSKKLAEFFKNSLGKNVLFTYEPSNGGIGKLIRKYLVTGYNLPPRSMALLFAADRANHYNNEIKPFLEQENSIVICDRYLLSSYAYQSVSTKDPMWIRDLNRGVPNPDLTIFLDIPTSVAIDRVQKRGSVKELYEDNFFQMEVNLEYKAVVKQYSLNHNVITIDATQGINEIHNEIVRTITI